MLSQRIIAYVEANQHWAFSVHGEHLYTRSSDEKVKNLFFGDLSLKYKRSGFDVGVMWNNIFNQKQYRTVVYDELNVYTYNYKLRPANLFVSISYTY